MVTRVSKCHDKRVTMERLFSVVVGLFLFISELCAQSPCPGIFDYHNEGGVLTGIIRIPPSGPKSTVVTRVNFSIAARLPTRYVGRLEPIDPEQGLQKYNRGYELIYRVHFPVTSPLPRLTSLVTNGQQLCYGPSDIPGPNQYVSTISLQHMLYLRQVGSPNSVFFQYDAPETFNNGPVYNDLPGTRPVGTRPQTNFYPEYHDPTVTEQPQYYDVDSFEPPTPRPTRPRPQYPVRPQPQPAQPAQPYDPYETEKPPQREPPPQPVPDIDPYDRDNTFVQPTQPPRTRPAPVPSISPGRVECGVIAGGNDKVPLVMNGQSYERGEWPWLVAIYKRNDGSLTFKCGGTLISDRHVVTAAHCMSVRSSMTSMRDIVVKVGVYNLEDWGDDQTVTRILESATLHEEYNATSLANDIMVFTLEKSVEFNNNIRPACLWEGKPDLNRIVGASGVVAGWGKNELGPAGHGDPRMVRLPIVSTSTCRASKPDFHKLTSDTTLCAGDRNGSGPCLGDSGGGLYLLDGGRWRLRGVVSLSLQPASGERTCDLDQYVIFTDAAKYIKWIRNIVQSSQF